MPIIVMREKTREVMFAHRVNAKGADLVAVKQLIDDLNTMGIRRAIFESDQEPAIKALWKALQGQES